MGGIRKWNTDLISSLFTTRYDIILHLMCITVLERVRETLLISSIFHLSKESKIAQKVRFARVAHD